jgi:hypothetical protein
MNPRNRLHCTSQPSAHTRLRALHRHNITIAGRFATLSRHQAVEGGKVTTCYALLEIGGRLQRGQLLGHGSDDELVERGAILVRQLFFETLLKSSSCNAPAADDCELQPCRISFQ